MARDANGPFEEPMDAQRRPHRRRIQGTRLPRPAPTRSRHRKAVYKERNPLERAEQHPNTMGTRHGNEPPEETLRSLATTRPRTREQGQTKEIRTNGPSTLPQVSKAIRGESLSKDAYQEEMGPRNRTPRRLQTQGLQGIPPVTHRTG